MQTAKIAKLFNTGGSQAVRLPAEFRFSGTDVFIQRDERTGGVILLPRERKTWANFVALREQLRADIEREGGGDFMRDRQQPADTQRDPFADWQE